MVASITRLFAAASLLTRASRSLDAFPKGAMV
jgi:hypothetical protein